jgi:hypothetical protein
MWINPVDFGSTPMPRAHRVPSIADDFDRGAAA